MILQTGAQVADKAVQGLLSRVDQLAEKLGTTAANVWAIYVAQARVEAIRDLIASVMFVIGAAFLVRFAVFAGGKAAKAKEESRYGTDGDGWVAIAVISGILVGIGLVLAAGSAYDSLGEWMNPQFWAFQHITADIKGLL